MVAAGWADGGTAALRRRTAAAVAAAGRQTKLVPSAVAGKDTAGIETWASSVVVAD